MDCDELKRYVVARHLSESTPHPDFPIPPTPAIKRSIAVPLSLLFGFRALMREKGADGLGFFEVIEGDLEDRQEGNGQEHAADAPHPTPQGQG